MRKHDWIELEKELVTENEHYPVSVREGKRGLWQIMRIKLDEEGIGGNLHKKLLISKFHTSHTETTMNKQTGRTPTSPADKARIDAMLNDQAEYVAYLAGRWADEREYEDVAEYAAAIAARLPAGIKLERMTKRPFGFEFSVGTDARYSMFCTARHVGWKRLG